VKVLHIIESMAPAGAEQVLVNTIPALRALGVESEVAVLWPPHDLAEPLQSAGISVHQLNLPSTWSVAHGIAALKSIVKAEAFDVIHAHLPMAVFYAAAARTGIPVVATFHGLSFQLYPATTALKKIRRQAERYWTNHRVHAYIAVSTAVADHYHEVLGVPREKIRIIPNGFPIDRLSRDITLDLTAVRSQYGVGPEEFLITHAGRLIPQKGHIHLLNAILELRNRGMKPRVLLFGKGPLQSQLDQFIEQNQLAEQVQIRGPLVQDELLKLLQASDLFVFPSVSEGFGMALGEAMCLGLPVIASDLPGIASLVEHGKSGLLVLPANPALLAEAMEQLILSRGLRETLAAAGQQRIAQNFSIQRIAAQILGVYEELISSL
jgi:glycosyltransferase involved in cell wall biosynthesis